MRDSINYNLKYFIMRTSGTKPMKNTMRKPSPLKIDGTIAAYLAEKRGEKPTTISPEQNEANKAKRDAHKASFRAAHKAKGTTKPVEGKPKLTKDNTVKVGGMIRVSKEKAAEVAAKKAKGTTKGATTSGTFDTKPGVDAANKAVANKKAVIKANAKKRTKGATTSGTYTTKKPYIKPTTETSVKTAAPKSNPAGKPASKMETSAKAPTMQMKKSGMGKKC
jgi:hypothetical protein